MVKAIIAVAAGLALMAGCGGQTADDIETRINERLDIVGEAKDKTQCEEVKEPRGFTCQITLRGVPGIVTLTDAGDGTLNAIVMQDGRLVDFFVLD